MNKLKKLLRTAGILCLAAAVQGCYGGRENNPLTETGDIPETKLKQVSITAAGSVEEEVLSLPRRYDARKDGRISPVKDQGSLGTCWAFASLLALESSLRPTEEWSFSADHMSNHPDFQLSQEEGGEFTMSMAYLLAWQGPVTEADDPYGDGISPKGLKAVKHVQDIQILPSGNQQSIKEAVLDCGGVQTSLYTTMKNGNSSSEYYNQAAAAYYCPAAMEPNHDVVIIGWDDDFSGDRFPGTAPGDGAYLCQNSWGTRFGENGCFYVSYWDANIAQNNILYSLVEDTDNYDAIYQSDLCGWVGQLGYGGSTAWAVNVYQAAGQEQLKAVGFYATNNESSYEVYVVRQVPDRPQDADFDTRVKAAEGTLQYAGFYTIPLTGNYDLEPGERFGVMIRLITPNVVHPIAIEYQAGEKKSIIDLSDGEGYISPDGDIWQNVETEQECNICLKAYTSKTDGGITVSQKIIFATGNEGKMREVRLILEDLGCEVLSLKELGMNPEIIENGATFAENAMIKAMTVWESTGEIVLADDSGLVVDYINGEPGIYSARYLGEDTSYAIKNQAIIDRLKHAKGEERSARFVCSIAAVLPGERHLYTEGTMEGLIAEAPAGSGGFGYDPIVYLPEFGMTAAQLTLEQKNKVSHRGKALAAMKEKLRLILEEKL